MVLFRGCNLEWMSFYLISDAWAGFKPMIANDSIKSNYDNNSDDGNDDNK